MSLLGTNWAIEQSRCHEEVHTKGAEGHGQREDEEKRKDHQCALDQYSKPKQSSPVL